jgi:hypothetical protein
MLSLECNIFKSEQSLKPGGRVQTAVFTALFYSLLEYYRGESNELPVSTVLCNKFHGTVSSRR